VWPLRHPVKPRQRPASNHGRAGTLTRSPSVLQLTFRLSALLDESSPEKAGVGGSIPSLATMFSITYGPSDRQFHSISFQNFDVLRTPLLMKTPFGTLAPGAILLPRFPAETGKEQTKNDFS
jgi:hypothetical protein